MKKIAILGLACLMLFSGCGKESASSTAPSAAVSAQEEVTMVVTEDTIGALDGYPNLRRADLTGSTCYAAIAAYAREHPDVEVLYTVDLGGTQVSSTAQELELEEDSYQYDQLLGNLRYLPELRTLYLPKTTLAPGRIEDLKSMCPEAEVRYSVMLLDKEVSSDVRELDLSGLVGEDVEAAARALENLPQLETVYLMDEGGKCALGVEDVWQLQQAAPNTLYDYSFDLFGLKVSTTDEKVEFRNKKIGDENEELLRKAMDIMKGCTYMSFEHCRQSDENLARLREDYRGKIKVAWRIYFAKAGSCMTDRTVLRYVYNVTNSTVTRLKYCEDVEYIDFGHNEILSDWSWVAYMPKLKAIIVSGSIIKDLTPFENCKQLEFLELSNCGLLTDCTPLAQCESLKRLNISYTKIEDLSPLDDLPLECLVYVKPKASEEELARFEEKHPGCVTLYEGEEYGWPWRYEKDGTPTEAYRKLQEVFHYPDATDTTW